MEKVAKYRRKVESIALLFCCFFLPIYEKMGKGAKNGRKVKAITLLFWQFFPVLHK
jgi:hypothetical protein